MNALSVAARGKGSLQVVRRAGSITSRYGLGSERIERKVESILGLLERFDGRATLPVTATAVQRHPRALERFVEHGIEFAVHGLFHVDHVGLEAATQRAQFERAVGVLTEAGLPAVGFRAPYLRWTDGTIEALRESGFDYDSSQALSWPLIDPPGERYARALAFYGAVSASERPSLPTIEGGVVRIPYCLPDDEAVVERLGLAPTEIARLWTGMFRAIHRRGEVFTLAVHPERIRPCADGIAAVLEDASRAVPPVWFARLDEVARWWRDRTGTSVHVHEQPSGQLRLHHDGPPGTRFLVRGLEVADGERWADGWTIARGATIDVATDRRPLIAVDPRSAPALTSFLRQQGFLVESVTSGGRHTVFLHRPRFGPADQLDLLDELERGREPLVRLSRWPDGAKSALCLTGDLDALTLWDYALRAFGR